MKIAIVSSGLWHIRRGIETWASTLAEALVQKAVDVTLFCGSPLQASSSCALKDVRVVPCLFRGTKKNRFLTSVLSKFGGWRYGFGSEYQAEQATMASGLIKALNAGGYEIVHLQDPWLALLLEKAHVAGRHAAKVILAHGTEEPIEFLRKFSHVQELSPYYLNRHGGNPLLQGQTRHCIPNFVNTNVFKPADKHASRKLLGLPANAFVILSVGAVDHTHKRMRNLIDEFALVERKDALLVIAGPCASESGKDLVSYANKMLGDRFRYYGDLGHDAMPGLYSVADLFVLCSLSEIFGIVFLEAMACGVPCLGHTYPVTEWIIGEKAEGGNLQPEAIGGKCLDMTRKGWLSDFISSLSPEWLERHGMQARARVERMFSREVVVAQIVTMYKECASL